jgi:acetoin:2,6-dichlorophenolindophenol oxidoreductase subunit alpha
VPPAMLEQWAAKDPIPRYEKRLIAAHVATQEELDQVVARIDAALQEDLAAAEASPFPEPESGLDGVYADRDVAPPTPLLVVEWESRKDRG